MCSRLQSRAWTHDPKTKGMQNGGGVGESDSTYVFLDFEVRRLSRVCCDANGTHRRSPGKRQHMIHSVIWKARRPSTSVFEFGPAGGNETRSGYHRRRETHMHAKQMVVPIPFHESTRGNNAQARWLEYGCFRGRRNLQAKSNGDQTETCRTTTHGAVACQKHVVIPCFRGFSRPLETPMWCRWQVGLPTTRTGTSKPRWSSGRSQRTLVPVPGVECRGAHVDA